VTKRFRADCFLFFFALGACGGPTSRDSDISADGETDAVQPTLLATEAVGWGPKLLSLIPERGDGFTPSLASVQAAFKDCGIGAERALRGRCDLSARAPTSPSAPSVRMEIVASGREARAIRLTACCAADKDFFRPIETEAVIRTELICPELTIVSSETVQAFRVSSAGKRDFVYAKGSRTTPDGRLVDLTMFLTPIEQTDECSSLAGTHQFQR